MSNFTNDGDLYTIRIPCWLARREELKPTPKSVYGAIRLAGYGTQRYYASHEYLADMLGCSEDTIQRALAILKKLKLIDWSRKNKNQNNTYTFPHHIWIDEERDRIQKIQDKRKGSNISDNSQYDSDTAKPRVESSEPAKPRVANPQNRGSIYKEISVTEKSKKALFDYWLGKVKNHYRVEALKFTEVRSKALDNVLVKQKRSEEEVMMAIDGCTGSKFNQDNKEMDLTLICRPAKIDSYIAKSNRVVSDGKHKPQQRGI